MTTVPKPAAWKTVLAALLLAAILGFAWIATSASVDVARGAESGQTDESGGHGEEGGAEIDPLAEFDLSYTYGPELKVPGIGLDMSINKAVIYLWLGALLCCLFTVYVARRMRDKPDRKQTIVESAYEFSYDFLAKRTLGEKTFSRYMPYVASLFMFLWFVNIVSFFPLPFSDHHTMITIAGIDIPSLGLYAATSNINVTLALTMVTIVASHYEGLRHNGPRRYFASWAAPGNLFIRSFTWVLHAMSETLRIVSLSVRLFANMLGGHLLILMMLSLAGIIGTTWVALGGVPVALAFFLFEFVLVATLQAFIFAILSGLYIGGAAEPAH